MCLNCLCLSGKKREKKRKENPACSWLNLPNDGGACSLYSTFPALGACGRCRPPRVWHPSSETAQRGLTTGDRHERQTGPTFSAEGLPHRLGHGTGEEQAVTVVTVTGVTTAMVPDGRFDEDR